METVVEVKQEYEAEQVAGCSVGQRTDAVNQTKNPAPAPAPGGEDDFYEEEMMLLVDFDQYLKMDDLLNPQNVLIKVIGIDSESPIIQVNEEVYRGTYDYAFGTNVFFERDPERTATLDPVFENNTKQMYRYVDKTDKVLRMKRIFATHKENPIEEVVERPKKENSSSDEEEWDEKYEVDMTYEDALNLHLSPGAFPPRHISDRQNGATLVKKRHLHDPKLEKGEISFD